jgi:phage tail sheath protein FI
MAVQTSYPGVYVAEVSSGVRTIAGVSTSVTAFLGTALRGPINRAVTITSFAEFQRRFGGLSSNSEMSFSVKQFFFNGGTKAIIVRLARDPVAASRTFDNADAAPMPVLTVTARDQGRAGNNIQIIIDYNTGNPFSLFNLTASYSSVDVPEDNATETYQNLSMSSTHPRYVEAVINEVSELIRVDSLLVAGDFAAFSGTSTSGVIGDVATLVDATHSDFRILVDGTDLYTVHINPATDMGGATPADRIDSLCTAIEGKLPAGIITCDENATDDQIIITSGTPGESSRIEVLPGLINDAAARLRLGVANGGTESDASSTLRPAAQPVHSTLTGGLVALADITGPPVPDVAMNSFRLSLDNTTPVQVTIGTTALAGPGIDDFMNEIAQRIQDFVRALRPGSVAFRDFTCVAEPQGGNSHLILSSGTFGSGSSVVVTPEPGDDLADQLNLLVDGSATTATFTQAVDIFLLGGSELDITDATRYAIFTGNQALRTGLFALEGVDIFNILCLPGIEDSGILMECDAYCQSRRAFMIVDAPVGQVQPSQINATMLGTALPHSKNAAVYYPWIQIANPLNGGALRTTAPSGTIAGLYARIDGSRGVWKAPAGTEAVLNGVRRLTYTLTDAENGLLNPLGVNCLRIFPSISAVSWGSRTLDGADSTASEWKYIPVRRTALYIEESLYRGLKWVVFEPNDEPLWAQIRLNVGAFMHDLFRQGAFQGQKKNDAYFVKCDSETTTQNDINLGRVNIWVGFAPLKPAEFVILYLQQMAGQIQV